MTEQTVNTLAGLCDYIDQQETGTTMSLRNPNNPDRGYVVMTDATWEAAKTNMAIGLVFNATRPTPDLAVWNLRSEDVPDAVLDEYARLVGVPVGEPVLLSNGSPGSDWWAVPVHAVIGDRWLVATVAAELDVDGVRMWVGVEPVDPHESAGSHERSFAVVFAEAHLLPRIPT